MSAKPEIYAVVTVILASAFFFVGMHGVDNVHNFSFIANEINTAACQEAISFEDISDCNLIYCKNIKSVYMVNMTVMIVGFLALVGAFTIIWIRFQ